MKITPRLLQILPFLSTTWDQISSLHLQTKLGFPLLVVTLKEGTMVEIPNLAQKELDEIFQAHAQFTEKALPPLLNTPFSMSIPMKIDGAILDSMASQLQHNPEQANLPPMPTHILSKILTILKSLSSNDEEMILEKAHPGCNCTSCQLSRASAGEAEELVQDSDLTFRDWEVAQKNQKLYQVTNPLDTNEQYTVYLGEPIGCTCGCKNCEHIRAVLQT